MPAALTTKSTTLWSLGVVRDWVGITEAGDASQDAILKQLADGASEFIERHTRVKFVTRTITEVRDGDGSKLLFLRSYPVVTFTSLTVKRSPEDSAAETIDTGDYEVNLSTGKVWLHGDVLNKGVGNVTATYTAGYGAQDADTLPQDIVAAGLELVKLIYVEKTLGAVGAQSVSIGPTTFLMKPEWPKQIKDTLAFWHRGY